MPGRVQVRISPKCSTDFCDEAFAMCLSLHRAEREGSAAVSVFVCFYGGQRMSKKQIANVILSEVSRRSGGAIEGHRLRSVRDQEGQAAEGEVIEFDDIDMADYFSEDWKYYQGGIAFPQAGVRFVTVKEIQKDSDGVPEEWGPEEGRGPHGRPWTDMPTEGPYRGRRVSVRTSAAAQDHRAPRAGSHAGGLSEARALALSDANRVGLLALQPIERYVSVMTRVAWLSPSGHPASFERIADGTRRHESLAAIVQSAMRAGGLRTHRFGTVILFWDSTGAAPAIWDIGVSAFVDDGVRHAVHAVSGWAPTRALLDASERDALLASIAEMRRAALQNYGQPVNVDHLPMADSGQLTTRVDPRYDAADKFAPPTATLATPPLTPDSAVTPETEFDVRRTPPDHTDSDPQEAP